MVNNGSVSQDIWPAERVTRLVDLRLHWIEQAAEVVGGLGADVEEVFAFAGTERTRQSAWRPEQAAKVREISGRLGYGALRDLHSGLGRGICLIEGGLAWEMAAKVKALNDENRPRTLVFAGCDQRQLESDEHKFLRTRLGIRLPAKSSEYDLAANLARRELRRRPWAPLGIEDYGQTQDQIEPMTLNFGYDLTTEKQFVKRPTGQLVHLGGTEQGQSVQLLRVEAGQSSPRLLPDSIDLMRFMAATLTAQGDKSQPVVLITDNSSLAKAVDVEIAGLDQNRRLAVAMYGRATLAAVRGEIGQDEPSLDRLGSELRATYDRLRLLKARLTP